MSKLNKSDILELFIVALQLDLSFTLTKLHNAKMGLHAICVSAVINEFMLLC